MALRIRWVSGSLIASSRLRSSSVSPPTISRRTCLPQAAARSRTIRGTLDQTCSIGCMRVFMTPSCSSEAIRLSRWEALARSMSPSLASREIALRASTSSLTWRIRASSRSTSTRIEVSAAALRETCSASPADRLGGLARVGHLRVGSGRARGGLGRRGGLGTDQPPARPSWRPRRAPRPAARRPGADAVRFAVRLRCASRRASGRAWRPRPRAPRWPWRRLLLGFCHWAGLRLRVGGRGRDRGGLAGQHRLEAGSPRARRRRRPPRRSARSRGAPHAPRPPCAGGRRWSSGPSTGGRHAARRAGSRPRG